MWAPMPGTSKARLPTNTLAKLRVDAHLSPSAAAESLDIAEVDLRAIEHELYRVRPEGAAHGHVQISHHGVIAR